MAHRGEVHAAQPARRDTLDLRGCGRGIPHGQVREPDVTCRLHRAAVGEPLVVDADARGRELTIEGEAGVVAEQLREEGDGLEVLAPVEDDLGRDAVAVHVAQARLHVEVTVGALIRVRGEAGGGRTRVAGDVVARDQLVELGEVAPRAVVAQLRAEERSDVRVRRHDDHGCSCSGIG